ncbi:MAG: hypothetical protein IPP27_14580 [Bacteroidetes bacterium]|nr:hypothetical protein [Bacteroidota bacterium]
MLINKVADLRFLHLKLNHEPEVKLPVQQQFGIISKQFILFYKENILIDH